MKRQRIIFLILTACFTFSLSAQNIDINTLKTINRWDVYGAPDADSPSFPSGHTAAAFSLATSLSITYPKWYVIAPSAVWACGVGFARMNQGVHYPSDVVAGAAIGVGCAFVNVYVNRWLNKVLFGRQIK